MAEDDYSASLLAQLPPLPAGSEIRVDVHDGAVRIQKQVIVTRSAFLLLVAVVGIWLDALVVLFVMGKAAGGDSGPTPLGIGIPLAVLAAFMPWLLLLWLRVFLSTRFPQPRFYLTRERVDLCVQGWRFAVGRNQVTAVAAVLMPNRSWEPDFRGAWPRMRRWRLQKLYLVTTQGRVQMVGKWRPQDAEWMTRVMQIWGNCAALPVHDLARGPVEIPAEVPPDKRRSPRVLYLGLILLVLLPLGRIVVDELVPGLRSATWPGTQGFVFRAQGDRIQYEYQVNGDDYTNHIVGRFHLLDSDFVDTHPEGSYVKVFYDPQQPARSVLINGFSPGGWCMAGVFASLIGLMLSAVWGLMNHPAVREVLAPKEFCVARPAPLEYAAQSGMLFFLTPRARQRLWWMGISLGVISGVAMVVSSFLLEIHHPPENMFDYRAIEYGRGLRITRMLAVIGTGIGVVGAQDLFIWWRARRLIQSTTQVTAQPLEKPSQSGTGSSGEQLSR